MQRDMGKKYTVGGQMESWQGNMAQSLTFIVTADCNLRCKYCYITHKSDDKRMSFGTAKKFIDYILRSPIKKQKAVILDFIGGEPLLETKLIDQICDYFKVKTYEINHEWYWNYRISISTNGVNYSDEEVQNFIKKNYGKLSIGITLDGTKRKHDLQRVFPDGSGSYDVIKKNIPLWLSQFDGVTKVTFASEDLCYLKESIIDLWESGITEVAANVVYEDVWKPKDELIFEKQLMELAEYVVEHDLYDQYKCTLFDDYIGSNYSEDELINTSCGAGKMIAVDPYGNLYPCMRYYDYSLNNRKGYIIGNVEDGIDFEKVRPFGTLMYRYQSDKECLDCEVATGCTFCQGHNYDEAKTATNFVRTKYICKMHKARVRANDYYFSLLLNRKNIRRERALNRKKQMIFLLNENAPSICSYHNTNVVNKDMSEKDIMRGLEYCRNNFITPIFIHGTEKDAYKSSEMYDPYTITHVFSIQRYEDAKYEKNYMLVCDQTNYQEVIEGQSNLIFNVESTKIENLSSQVVSLLRKVNRINVNIQNLTSDFKFNVYKRELEKIAAAIEDYICMQGILKEVNVITDVMFMKKHDKCPAGSNSITYAPNGQVYICPATYFEREFCEKVISGDFEEGFDIANQHLYTNEYAALCKNCSAYQCENCSWINKCTTLEVGISPSFQCKKAIIENEVTCQLQKKIGDKINCLNKVIDDGFKDPYLKMEAASVNAGYYVV